MNYARRAVPAAPTPQTRRHFLKKSGLAPMAAILARGPGAANRPNRQGGRGSIPWYRRTYRWGQTNINEKDPIRYDIAWWREHWRKTRVQGLIINAGGIVAYYPSRHALQHRAEHLGNRNLFGELAQAAHQDGLVVFARMDSNRAHEPFYRAHPEWFAVNAEGAPYRAGDLYVTCISSPYYEEYIPEVLREIYEVARPEGFTDNSWSGLDRDSICYCKYCAAKFQAYSGRDLPRKKDWDGAVYRQWIRWSYGRRLEIWELNNRVTKAAGGPECLWSGMIGGDIVSQGRRFRDVKGICERAEIIMFDDQGRNDEEGFQSNGEMGKRIHGLLGWEKLIPESMAMYGRSPTFRKAASPEPEARMWMLEGIAGTIQPWWHHVGAYQEDRRQFRTAEPIYQWYEANQEYLVNRRPVATVGVVWSQQNADFYGRDEAADLAIAPYRGFNQALVRARIPYLPVHADLIERDAAGLRLLILPNLAAMSDSQVRAVRGFVEAGGGLIATGETSLCDEWGDRRKDFALGDLFGARVTGKRHGPGRLSATEHSYLRLSPDAGADVYGPRSGDEPAVSGRRHPVLRGFEETNILAFGGRLEEVKADPGTIVPLTLIPNFPIFPPETSWMRQPRTDIPALVIKSQGESRIAYLPADIDRRIGFSNLPDHGDLLRNLVRWAVRDDIPLAVEGPGLIDCHLYLQPGRLVLHLVNLTSAGTWRSPVEELIPVGPFQVRLKLPKGMVAKGLKYLVTGARKAASVRDGWVVLEVPSILDHQVIVVA